LRVISRTLGDLGRALRPPSLKSSRKRLIAQRQDGASEQRGVDGAGLADCERTNRNARRHLDNG
jgi:hypothetical protein